MEKDETKREKTIQCRVADTEYAYLEEKSDKIGLSVGSYLRVVSLLAKLDVSISQINVEQLKPSSEEVKKKAIKRDNTIQCRVSDTEYASIQAKADSIGLSISSYLRVVCLLSRLEVSL